MAARQERAAAEQRTYDALKQDLWRWSVGVTALFFAGSILLFSRVREAACASLQAHTPYTLSSAGRGRLPEPLRALTDSKHGLPHAAAEEAVTCGCCQEQRHA